MDRSPPGEGSPASRDHIDIGAPDFETAAEAAGQFGCDQRRARAEKRVIDQLARPAVVDDRTTHALDRLLRAVPPALLAVSIAEWVIVGDLPHCGLRAVALPVALFTPPHGVRAAFVLPVVIATAQGEVLLDPDDLGPRLQSASRQVGSHDIAFPQSAGIGFAGPGKRRPQRSG